MRIRKIICLAALAMLWLPGRSQDWAIKTDLAAPLFSNFNLEVERKFGENLAATLKGGLIFTEDMEREQGIVRAIEHGVEECFETAQQVFANAI